MDSVNTCARFLMIRLKLRRTERQVIRDVGVLFGCLNAKEKTRDLARRFRKSPYLTSILETLSTRAAINNLEEEDVIQLFDIGSLEVFSGKIGVETVDAIAALGEVIPVVVKRSLELEVEQPLDSDSLGSSCPPVGK